MLKCLVAAATLMASTLSAQAAAVYTDRAAFEAALAGTVTTESYDCGSCTFVYLGTGAVTHNGVSYANAGSNNFLIGTFYGQTVSGTDFMQVENQNVTLTFGSGIRAIGLDVDNLFSDYTFTLGFGGETISVGSTADVHRFVGIIADGMFTEASLSSTGVVGVQFDNLTTATDAALTVPEPATLALALPLFGALALSRRRRSTTGPSVR
jgi:opacity protein-like surface antigen